MPNKPLTEKQKLILGVLKNDLRWMSPTEIGELCGKTYDCASSWACTGLKPLLKQKLVTKKDRRYRLKQNKKS